MRIFFCFVLLSSRSLSVKYLKTKSLFLSGSKFLALFGSAVKTKGNNNCLSSLQHRCLLGTGIWLLLTTTASRTPNCWHPVCLLQYGKIAGIRPQCTFPNSRPSFNDTFCKLDHYCDFQINDKFIYIFKAIRKAEVRQKEEVGYNLHPHPPPFFTITLIVLG